ncbi:MAG: protein of unknown function endonuclease [Acidimicrobiales bacterium]|nr:protein of unknown function endonuclease [Acidimicrobiales bacterium]
MFGPQTARANELTLHQLRSVVRRLEPGTLSGPQAVGLLDWFAELERLAASGKALVAERAAATNQWRAGGDRSPEHWLGRRTGSTVGAAKDVLDTARRLKNLPATDEAVRSGRLSADQAAAVADGAAAAPDAEAKLLAAAPEESVRELRNRVERVKAAVRSAEDEQARDEAIRRGRYLRKTVSSDGSHELHARGTAASIAAFWARLQPHIDAQFKQARKDGRRESPEAYAYDALMAMSQTGGSATSPAKVIVRVDLSALRRGTTVPGEVCEIAGFGPISVAEAMRQMNDAFLALVCTKGKDVVNVVHLGRQFTEHQKTALEWANPECCVKGCSSTVRLERDHREDWARTRETRVPAADRLCHHHHRLKTAGWRLEAGNGKRRILPPRGQRVDAMAASP